MKFTYRWKYFLFVFLFASCFPCLISFNGIILDSSKGNIIDSVTVTYYQRGVFRERFTTDSTGYFHTETDKHHSGLFEDCDELKLEFSKEGYETIVYSTTSTLFDTIYLTKK